jgi:hypothetical protein
LIRPPRKSRRFRSGVEGIGIARGRDVAVSRRGTGFSDRTFQEASMKRLPILSMACAVVVAAPAVLADSTLHARLRGYEETPAVSTAATGSFTAKITQDNAIEYELSYADLEGDVTQSHIHFGKPGTSGGIAAWLCQGLTAGPVGTTNCDGARTGGATGVITAASVIGPAGQGIAPGEFEELLQAIREGATYVNVHSTLRPAGEIRGLLK